MRQKVLYMILVACLLLTNALSYCSFTNQFK